MPQNTNDKLEELEAALPFLPAALQKRRLGFALDKAIGAVKGFDYQIQRLEALTHTAETLGIQNLADEIDDIREAIDEADEFGGLMERANDSEQVTNIARDAQYIEREVSRFHRVVQTMLGRYITTKFGPLTSLGQLLTRMGQTELGSRLLEVETEGRNVARGSPLDWPSKVENLQSKGTELQAELKKLANNADVDAFLVAVGTGRTSLRLVTAAVLDWLEDHDALDRFQVVSA